MRTAISCSSSAPWRSRGRADASASCCPPGSPSITAARRFGACSSRGAPSTGSSASTIGAASFPFTGASGFCCSRRRAAGPRTEIGCRLGEHDPAVLETADDEGHTADSWFTLRLTPALLERLSGDDLAIPDLRTPLDLAIAERAATLFPPLGDERGWAARFGRELNATDDRDMLPPGRPRAAGRRGQADRAVPRATSRQRAAAFARAMRDGLLGIAAPTRRGSPIATSRAPRTG